MAATAKKYEFLTALKLGEHYRFPNSKKRSLSPWQRPVAKQVANGISVLHKLNPELRWSVRSMDKHVEVTMIRNPSGEVAAPPISKPVQHAQFGADLQEAAVKDAKKVVATAIKRQYIPTTDDHAHLVSIVRAHAVGQMVQKRSPFGWVDIEAANCSFEGAPYNYRLKPTIREWWVHIDRSGKVINTYDAPVQMKIDPLCIVHVREVLKNEED